MESSRAPAGGRSAMPRQVTRLPSLQRDRESLRSGRYGHVRWCWVSEGPDAVRRAKTCGTVPAHRRGAPDRGRAGAVGPGRDVVEPGRRVPGVARRAGLAAAVSGERVRRGDDRRGRAGAAVDLPALAVEMGRRVVHRHSGAGVGHVPVDGARSVDLAWPTGAAPIGPDGVRLPPRSAAVVRL
jgi:hypothetical protein